MGRRIFLDTPPPGPTPSGDPLLERLLAGEVVVRRGVLQAAGLSAPLAGDLLDGIQDLFGRDTRQAIAEAGLGRLHRRLDPRQILALHERVETDWCRRWREICPPLAQTLFPNLPVRVSARIWLRIVAPDDVLRPHAKSLRHFQAKLTHADPHRDSWVGLPNHAVTVWAAITDCAAEDGLTVYPECWSRPLRRAGRHGLDSAEPVGRASNFGARAGDAVLFGTHHLHGSRPIRADRTRITLSIRLGAGAPRLTPGGRTWVPFVGAYAAGRPAEILHRAQSTMSSVFWRWLLDTPNRRKRQARDRAALRADA